jgi:hypothetical protein
MTCPLSAKATVQCAHIPSVSHEAEPTGKPPFVFLLHRFIGNPKSPLVVQPSWVVVISTVSGLFWGLNAPGSGLSHITSLSPLQRTVSNTSLKLAVEPAFAETVRAARAAAMIRVFFILGVPFRCGGNFSSIRCQVPPLACPQRLVRQEGPFRARECLPGTYRFASGMTLLAAASSAGPSTGRVLRVIVALDGGAGGDGGMIRLKLSANADRKKEKRRR